ncbi:MAG: AmmeMemoRadiSam system protein A [Betaproteobacteria bacterium HGW-Betaproteobacteria-16]|jgi:AmmeMemoRadiSam system protein A|nr:MAG: AmmeMemoRadiSam system protein A [Betaproteobacteria bacterium HGW-Betaproteobacteria-16]
MTDFQENTLQQEAIGHILVPLARREIAQALALSAPAVDQSLPRLQQHGATFVTLTQQRQLRGCIGTLQAYRPLLHDLKANAYAAAFRDPRFSPLQAHELDETDVEVSLLSAMQPLQFRDEQEAWSQLRAGEDGVVLEFGSYRSTFLPQVWEQLPEVRDFMARLKQKAGLPATFWHEEVRLSRYTVRKFRESDMAVSVDARRATA